MLRILAVSSTLSPPKKHIQTTCALPHNEPRGRMVRAWGRRELHRRFLHHRRLVERDVLRARRGRVSRYSVSHRRPRKSGASNRPDREEVGSILALHPRAVGEAWAGFIDQGRRLQAVNARARVSCSGAPAGVKPRTRIGVHPWSRPFRTSSAEQLRSRPQPCTVSALFTVCGRLQVPYEGAFAAQP